jgi:hypothetical protein
MGRDRRGAFIRANDTDHLHGRLFLDGAWSDGTSYLGRYLSVDEGSQSESAIAKRLLEDIHALAHLADALCAVQPSPIAQDATTRKKIVSRLGQPKFRSLLMRWFDGRCVVSGSKTIAVLEAVHILPHRDRGEYEVDNGLLMRADLHLLFDLGLLQIVTGPTAHVRLASQLKGTEYDRFDGRALAGAQRLTPGHLKALRGRSRRTKQR